MLSDNGTVDFVYKYTNHDGTEKTIEEKIELPFDGDVGELVNKMMNEMEPMMRYLDADVELKEALGNFIRKKNQEFLDSRDDALIEKARRPDADLEALIKETEKLYKEELLQFADRIGPTDEEIFAQSFHRLVHSSSLPEILVKEKGYAKTVADLINRMDTEVEALNSEQQEEMDKKINQLDISTTSEDINKLLAHQYTTHNFVRKKFESELEAIHSHQRNEYREWITGQVSKVFQTSRVATPLGNRSSMFVTQTPSMEESFTIHLGSQLKHMHNIRILSADVTDLCSPLHADESLGGLNMALGLYSSSLCGVVVLTPSGQVAANKKIVKNANMSTEFHFDQIDDQLEKIQTEVKNLNTQDAASNEKSISKLKTGDFFITKHSNLSQSHVIFHLISDEPFNSPSEINSRHPVILGLRNILKTASKHDVTMLTIPALLRHEMSEDMTVSWCMRRAELVFKCAKGFMIESASWGGAELSTLQLLLPREISEELFTTLAGMVPHVFRVANPKILESK
ncbi:unnamed protein product [Hermetia illucens]|uniref:Uncharacterized protein n=1 Tax=Hermetia illucens TaxID=343691 RepID=A0A7R8YU49_HERIL|nr:protein C12orf4 homolog [Hermetia illucens]CAD7084346.1 unnamed protein product [Hermetia illucens]